MDFYYVEDLFLLNAVFVHLSFVKVLWFIENLEVLFIIEIQLDVL